MNPNKITDLEFYVRVSFIVTYHFVPSSSHLPLIGENHKYFLKWIQQLLNGQQGLVGNNSQKLLWCNTSLESFDIGEEEVKKWNTALGDSTGERKCLWPGENKVTSFQGALGVEEY